MKSAPKNGADGGAADDDIVANGLHECPLTCIPFHRHVELTDRSGRVAATLCGLCGQPVTREQWAAAFEGRL